MNFNSPSLPWILALVTIISCCGTGYPPRRMGVGQSECSLHTDCRRRQFCSEQRSCVTASRTCEVDADCGRGNMCLPTGACIDVNRNPPEGQLLVVVSARVENNPPMIVHGPVRYHAMFSCVAREIHVPNEREVAVAPHGVFTIRWPEGCSSNQAQVFLNISPVTFHCGAATPSPFINRNDSGQRLIQVNTDCMP